MAEGPQPDTDINPAIGAILRSMRDSLTHEHALFSSLGLKPLLVGRGQSQFSLDIPEDFSDGSGLAHSGFVTIVLDSIMGLTVFTALEEFKPIATINLRTDYLDRIKCGVRAVCACNCQTIIDEIAYVKGEVSSEDGGAPIATATGAFMVGTRGPTKGSRL